MTKSHMKFNSRSLLLAIVMCVGFVGCVQNPIDGKVLESRKGKVTFSGTHSIANRGIRIQARNASNGSYTTLGSTVSGSALTDSEGSKWYTWSKTVSLPMDEQFWVVSGTSPNKKATITTRAFDPTASLEFSTFNVYGAVCLYSYLQQDMPGLDIMYDCSTGTTVNLNVWCGDLGESCCPPHKGSTCGAGLTCKGDMCVKPAMDVEVCTDDDDEDCVVDEDAIPCATAMKGMRCRYPLNQCHTGLTSIDGKFKCDANDNPYCYAQQNVDWCQGCVDSLGSLCGDCPGNQCKSDAECWPGAKCVLVPNDVQRRGKCTAIVGCNANEPYCYHPRDSSTSAPPSDGQSGDACQ